MTRIEIEEVGCAINQMNIEKVSGPSGVKMFKAGGNKWFRSLTHIFNILFKDKLLEERRLSSLVPIFKGKGDPP